MFGAARLNVEITSFQYQGKKVHLIETPGFNDHLKFNFDILNETYYWLCLQYGSNFRLSGIIHLHPIASPRMSVSDSTKLQVLQRALEPSKRSPIALVTTKWDIIKPEISALRETELKSMAQDSTIVHWNFVTRYENSQSSALSIIDMFMTKEKGTLNRQHRFIDQHKTLDETAAGQELQKELEAWNLKLEHYIRLDEDSEDKEPLMLKAELEKIQRSLDALRFDAERILARKTKSPRKV